MKTHIYLSTLIQTLVLNIILNKDASGIFEVEVSERGFDSKKVDLHCVDLALNVGSDSSEFCNQVQGVTFLSPHQRYSETARIGLTRFGTYCSEKPKSFKPAKKPKRVMECLLRTIHLG